MLDKDLVSRIEQSLSIGNGSPSTNMDVYESLNHPSLKPITCIEMHTAGEPTRIVVSGYPNLQGTLLHQRAQALVEHDHIRRRLMLEPRGHFNMYGAILRQKTELTESGDAHIGVLFMTNDGYSTMCGHATIALGRLLVDTHDPSVFPARSKLRFDRSNLTTTLILHTPCGPVETIVPTTADGRKSDSTRPVAFLSVPSFATGLDIKIPLTPEYLWSEIKQTPPAPVEISANFCYGGAYYCVVNLSALGFTGALSKVDLDAASKATANLKAAINKNAQLRHLFSHPEHEELGFLYSIVIVDDMGQTEPVTVSAGQENGTAATAKGCKGNELGLCFFSDQQVDRSPTGSAVAARVALALAEGKLGFADKWEYHSLFTRKMKQPGFVGSVQEIRGMRGSLPVTRVKVEGFAFYTGTQRFVVEEADPLGDNGFLFDKLVMSDGDE